MKRIWMLVSIVVLALGVGEPAPAQAFPVLVDFAVNFYPPNPCDATELGDLSGGSLQGAMALYYQTTRNGDLLSPEIGLPDAPAVSCGESAWQNFSFDLDTADSASLFASFEGGIFLPNPGPSNAPVFAMLSPESGQPELPASAPILFWGELQAGQTITQEFPLYAFASPGHEIGSLTVQASAVPEPGTLALMFSGLGALAARRRSRQKP